MILSQHEDTSTNTIVTIREALNGKILLDETELRERLKEYNASGGFGFGDWSYDGLLLQILGEKKSNW